MNFDELLSIVGDEPLFETSLLLAGEVEPAHIHRQLARWVKAGRLIRLRRGLYALAPPYRKRDPHHFLVSNRLSRPSCVSLHSALAFHGLIPEAVTVTTGVTTRRPERLATPLGEFEFRHIKKELFFGYSAVDVAPGQTALVARAEKALLDLVYLTAGVEGRAYLEGLRLQGLDDLKAGVLEDYAARFESPKIERAAGEIERLARRQAGEYEKL